MAFALFAPRRRRDLNDTRSKSYLSLKATYDISQRVDLLLGIFGNESMMMMPSAYITSDRQYGQDTNVDHSATTLDERKKSAEKT